MHAVLESVAEPICRELTGLDAEATQIHPGGKARIPSAQQIIEDLVQSYRSTARSLEVRLDKGRITRKQERTRLQWFLQIMILSFGHIPEASEFCDEAKANPVRFSPMSGHELGWTFRKELEAMDALLDRCRQKFGMERVAVQPLLGPLRVDQWRRFHVVHGLHRLRQLQNVVRATQAIRHGSPRTVNLAQELQIPAQRPFA